MNFLEGAELEKEYDAGAGKLVVDVTDKGEIKFSNVYAKDLGGFAKVKNITEVESNIFMIAEAIAKKTATEWDDKAIAGLKSILGIVDAVAPAVEAPQA
jgi:hypothetical protein